MDLSRLFNFDAFVRSRESSRDFYSKFVRTQLFEKFIGDRSGVPNDVCDATQLSQAQRTYYMFFDACCQKVLFTLPSTNLQVEAVQDGPVPLLERGDRGASSTSSTIFVAPPEPPTDPPGPYKYSGMPLKLDERLFALDQLNAG